MEMFLDILKVVGLLLVGAVIGFFSGILLDFNQGHTIGLYAFLLMYIGLILGQFNKRFFKDNYLILLIIIVICIAGINIIANTIVYTCSNVESSKIDAVKFSIPELR